MPNLEHLSYSSISSYLLCPKSWRYHYIDKIEVPAAPALVFGSAFHDAVEQYMLATTPQKATEFFSHALQQHVEQERAIEWGADSLADLLSDGMRILQAPKVCELLDDLHGRMGIEPTVEKRVELQVPGVPIPILGYIDVITADGVPGDFKTSAYAWTQDKAEGETQSLFYLAALNQAGIQVPGNTFRHYIFTKNSKPTAQVFEHSHSSGEVFWLFEMIQQVWRGIESEVFPSNPTGWKCSAKFCDYWALCRGRYV